MFFLCILFCCRKSYPNKYIPCTELLNNFILNNSSFVFRNQALERYSEDPNQQLE